MKGNLKPDELILFNPLNFLLMFRIGTLSQRLSDSRLYLSLLMALVVIVGFCVTGVANKMHDIKAGKVVYIIEFMDEPISTYKGYVEGYPPTSPSVTGNKLDFSQPAIIRYRAYLQSRSAGYLEQIQKNLMRDLSVIRNYDVAFFGVAVEISPGEARQIRMLPGIKQIRRDEMRILLKEPEKLN